MRQLTPDTEMRSQVAYAGSSSKIIFADQLRALAFLCVVLVHWVGVYAIHKDVVSYLTHAPLSHINIKYIYEFINPPLVCFNYGPFGVGLFFLISGFVVPFSMKNKSGSVFLKNRLLRIYPTYIFCATFMLIFTYLLSVFFWKEKINLEWVRVISNILLVNNILAYPSIDGVNWTLAIEVKFYIVCAIFSSCIIKRPFFFIIFYSAFSLTFSIFSNLAVNVSFLHSISNDLSYISFMLVGYCFYLHLNKSLSARMLLFIALTSLSSFLVSQVVFFENKSIPVITSYLYSLVFFGSSYVMRDYFKNIYPISFLSRISYPFYALHAVVGYSILRLLEFYNVCFYISFFITFIIVLLLSLFVHVTVEKRFTNS